MSANTNLRTLEGMKETILKLQGIEKDAKKVRDSERYQTESKETNLRTNMSDQKNKTFYSNSTTTMFKMRPFSAKIGGVRNTQSKWLKSRQLIFQAHTESIEEV